METLFSGRKDGVHNDETSDPVESEPKGLEALTLQNQPEIFLTYST